MKRAYERKNGQTIDRMPKHTVYGVERRRAGSLASLLRRIEHDQDWDAASQLIEKRETRGVREAVRKLALRTRSDNEAVWRVIGELGGKESRVALERRLRVVANQPPKREVNNWRPAQEAAGLARKLLELDPDFTFGAQVLVRMFRHPIPYNRMFAVWESAGLVRDAAWTHTHTEAIDLLRRALRPMLRTKEKQVFVKAIPGLIALGLHSSVRARCKTIFRGKDEWLRLDMASMLMQTRTPHLHFPLIVEWLGHEPSIRARVEVMAGIPEFIPTALLQKTCAEALANEAPSIRDDALRIAQHVPLAVRRQLLRRAVKDEPDRSLRTQMRRMLRSAK